LPTPTTGKRHSAAALKKASKGRKLAEVVAETIEQQIIKEGWPLGAVLGSEPELLERYEVSRAVLREAIRIVEHHSVARMRRGPNGGLVVTAPDISNLSKTAALLLDFKHVSGQNLVEARAVVEIAAVEQATKALDEEGIARLKEALELESLEPPLTDPSGLELDGPHEIHGVIAELSGNPALHLFVDILVQLTSSEHGRFEYRRVVRSTSDRDRVAQSIHTAHYAIVEAMISGDAALAMHRMRRHLDAMSGWIS
jgi:DNA-binding FadR family transcriptional regulator